MNEVVRIRAWITHALLADTQAFGVVGNNIYPNVAERGVQGVYVAYSYVGGGEPKYVLGHRRSMTGGLFDIAAWGKQEDLAAIKTVADRIDEIFSKAVNVQWQGWNFSGVMTDLIDKTELDEAESTRWVSLGGTYRITAWEIAAAGVG